MNKEMLYIDDKIAYNEYKEYLNTSPKIVSVEGNVIITEDYTVEVKDEYLDIMDLLKSEDDYNIIENSGYKFKTYQENNEIL